MHLKYITLLYHVFDSRVFLFDSVCQMYSVIVGCTAHAVNWRLQ